MSISKGQTELFLEGLEGPELYQEIRKLTPREQEALAAILVESAAFGWSDTYTKMVSIDWEMEPATPREFLTNPYYKGPDATIYPLLVDCLDEALTDPMIYEIIMTGAIGYGKSFGCGFGIAYEVHRLLCMRNPQGYAGINRSTKLQFINMSVSADNADSVLYSYIFNAIENSPWFKEHFPIDERTGLFWPKKNIEIRSGSSSEVAVIGSNLVGSAMDEANFMANAKRSRRAIMAGEKDVAFSIYNQITKRRVSRFLKSLKGDRIPPARMWLLSSKQFPGDFLEKRIDTVEEMILSGSPVNSYIIDCDQWTPKMSLGPNHPDNPYTSGLWFPVLIGDAMNQSQILSEELFEDKDEMISKYAELVSGDCEIVAVPSELLLKFKEDLPNAIRDLCGKSIHSKRPFINDPEGIKRMICNVEVGDVQREHPYEFTEYHILSPELIRTELVPIQRIEGIVKPLINPKAPRYGHGDLALNRQSAGLAVNHFGGYKEILTKLPRQVYEDGVLCTRFVDVIERRPIIITDFMIRIVPPEGGEIDLKSFRFMFYALERIFGFKYDRSVENAVSFDQFQSGETLQEMRDQGYRAARFSVDRNPDAYEFLKSAIRDGRFSCYMYKPFLEDIASLERDPKKGKIIKGAGRTHGDVSDCVAANVFKIEEKYKRIEVPLIADAGNDNHLLNNRVTEFERGVQPGHMSEEERIEFFDDREHDPFGVDDLFDDQWD